jgi:hypothetical protein
MLGEKEQIFGLNLGRSNAETFEMLKTAFGDECLSRAHTFECFKRFKYGQTSVNDNPRSGQPSTSRNDDSLMCVKINLCK